MSLSSTEYAQDVNEFEKAGFTQVASEIVKPPRVGEAPISFECTVDNNGDLDTQKLDLVARMGGSWYCRANGDALFEIPKPIFNKGIGVDQLPSHVLESSVLTGNHLGRLGNMEAIPSDSEIAAQKSSEKIIPILEEQDALKKREALHQYALSFIEKNDLEKALSILFCLN
ncbi:hypothetical protein GQR58_028284 [Nymphon striatum]|nr:hypothetical protein GQR58_028284 [Nymphon striatum]